MRQRLVPTGLAEAAGSSISEVIVRNAVVRACERCEGPRQIGEPCAACGNPNPPRIDDLGVVSTWFRNPVKRWWWAGVGQHLAARRAARVAATTRMLNSGRARTSQNTDG